MQPLECKLWNDRSRLPSTLDYSGPAVRPSALDWAARAGAGSGTLHLTASAALHRTAPQRTAPQRTAPQRSAALHYKTRHAVLRGAVLCRVISGAGHTAQAVRPIVVLSCPFLCPPALVIPSYCSPHVIIVLFPPRNHHIVPPV